MYLELPVFRRCCCCLPLRCGIIVFGYVNLVIALLMIALEVVTLGKMENDLSRSVLTMFNGVAFIVQSWVAFMLYGVDIIFNIVLLVGGHKKDSRLLKVYSYYGIVTCFATLILFIVMRFEVYEIDNSMLFHLVVTETCFTITAIGIKIYLLLLIRSELKKLKRNSVLRFSSKTGVEGNPF